MPKDDSVLLNHMLDTARRISQRGGQVTREIFDRDEDLRDALALRVQIIGEAASKISMEYRQRHTTVPWGRIVAMRHRIVHDYMNVDFDILWQVVKKDIPELIASLERIRPSE